MYNIKIDRRKLQNREVLEKCPIFQKRERENFMTDGT